MGSAYDRSLYVITAAGDRGPYTRDEVRDLLQRGEVTSTCRLRSAAARDLGTVGDLLRRPPRRSSEPRLVPIQRPLTVRLFFLLGLTLLVGGVVQVVSRDRSGERVPLTEAEPPLPPPAPLPLPPDPAKPASLPVPASLNAPATPLRPLPPPPTISKPDSSVAGASAAPSIRRLLGCDPRDGLAGLINDWSIRDDERGGISLRQEDGITFIRLASQGDRSCMLKQVIPVDPAWRTVSIRARVRATVGQVGKEPWFLPRMTFQWGDHREDRHETAIQWRESISWCDLERTITVPDGSRILRVWVGTNRCTGHLDVAHLEITTP